MPTIPNGAESEVTFVSGITNTGSLAATDFWTWKSGTIPATYQPSASGALKWGGTTPGTSGGTVTYWFDAASNWTAAEQNAFISGLALWADEANITFARAANAASANQTFIRNAAGSKQAYETSTSATYSTIGSGTDGHNSKTEIHFDTSQAFWHIGTSFDDAGGYGWQSLVHEEGHMIGLGHGGPYNGEVNSAVQQFGNYDTRLWTLMSYIDPSPTSSKYYSSYPVTGTNWGTNSQGYGYEPTTPMILDILAAQRIYGAPTSGPLVSGGQIFGFHSNISGPAYNFFDFTVNQHPVVTIWDGGLNNTLDLSGFSAKATINLNPGTFSSANGMVNNIAIAEDTIITNVIGGSGSDIITGNSANNTITGGPGNDTINGGLGIDTAVFSGARSAYTITTLSSTSVRVSGPDGTDTLTNVEKLQFSDQTITLTTSPTLNPDLIYQKMYGVAPSSAEHNALINFANSQYTFGQQLGVQDSVVYAYQALGLALAEASDTGSTAFKNSWGPTTIASDTTFVSQAYSNVFGHSGSAAQVSAFVSQVNFFKALYTASHAYGADANRIDLLARGAVYGQMIGVQVENPSSATVQSNSGFDSTGASIVSIDSSFNTGGIATDGIIVNLSPNDDYADSLTDTTHPFGAVAVNGSSTGTLDVTGDRDWFGIQLTAGTSYVINLQGQQAGAGTLADPYLRLHNSIGTLVAENDDIVPGVNSDSGVTFTALTSGTYYIEAGAYADSYTGTYKVSVSIAPPHADDYANSLTDTTHPFGAVTVNGSNTGTLEINGDRDWFGVQLTAGTSYVIDLQGQHAGTGTLPDPYLRLHDSTGALVRENDDIVLGTNPDSELNFTATASGTYYIEAGAYHDNYTGTYKVSVSIAPPHADDYANSLTDTTHPFGAVAVNGSSTGTLEINGDRDWFGVQLTAGTAYVIDLQGQQTGAGTLPDPYLRLHDSTGALVRENDDIALGSNPDSELNFTATSSGTYYIEAGAYNDSYTGTYTVAVGVAPPHADDYADFLTDTTHPFGVVTVNGSSTGTLEINGDRDWFGVQLTAGTSYVIDLHGQQTGAGTLPDPYLRLHDSTGALVRENDDILVGVNPDSELNYTATTSGTYYIEAGAYNDSYTGTYTVAVGVAPPHADDYADFLTDTTHPFGVVTVNGSSTGTLEVTGDRDWFKVQLTAGTSYKIDLQGQHAGTGTLADPYLRLHNSSGTVVAENDDIVLNSNPDSELTFTATTNGTYYIEAGAYNDSFAGTYTVSVSTSTVSPTINPDLVYQKMYGVAPSSTEHNALVQFDTAQYASGQQIGVADPVLFVYQALGLALAEGSDTGSTAFKTTWGPTSITSDTTFVSQAYTDVFGHAGSAAQVQQFVSQVNFFVSIYTASGTYGTDANRIDLLARGAVYGQMIGVLAENPASAPVQSTANMASADTPLIGINDALNISSLAAAA